MAALDINPQRLPPPTEKMNVGIADCPVHADCTMVAFSSQGGTIAATHHLNRKALADLHRIFGQRLLALDVPQGG